MAALDNLSITQFGPGLVTPAHIDPGQEHSPANITPHQTHKAHTGDYLNQPFKYDYQKHDADQQDIVMARARQTGEATR